MILERGSDLVWLAAGNRPVFGRGKPSVSRRHHFTFAVSISFLFIDCVFKEHIFPTKATRIINGQLSLSDHHCIAADWRDD